MAILADFNNIANAVVHKALYSNELTEETTSSLLFLGKIRQINSQFRDTYGELILCADHRSWRLDEYPFYKHRRRMKKEEEEKMEDAIFQQIYEEIHDMWETLSAVKVYQTVKVYGAEGDDIMATLAQKLPGKHLIVSGDKDMTQLTRFSNIKVYNPIKKEMVDNGKDYYRLLTLTGDSGDDIPNILSDDDTFADPDKKQRTLSAKMKQTLMEAVDIEETIKSTNFKHIPASEVLKNYHRNKKLIDLTEIPENISEAIMAEHAKPFRRGDVMNMLVRLSASLYMNQMDDFVPKVSDTSDLDIF